MSFTATKPRTAKELKALEKSWGSATLSALKLPSLRKSDDNGLGILPPKPVRSPELIDKINKVVMTYDQLEAKIGHFPHADKLGGLWKMSKNYKAMRNQLDAVGRETAGKLEDIDVDALRAELGKLEKAGDEYAKQHKSDPNRAEAGTSVADGARSRQAQLEAVMADPDFDKVKAHITIEQAMDCKARGIRFKDCDFDTLNDTELKTVNEKFGAGAANSVSLITFKDDSFRVFKAEPVSDPTPLSGVGEIGIDATSPHNGNRNIASTAMADVLGVSVIAKSSFGMHKNPVTDKVEIGLMMEKAEGVTPAQVTYTPYKKPTTGGKVSTMMDRYKADPTDQEAADELKKQGIRLNAAFIEGTTPEDERWEKGKPGLKKPWNPPISKKAQAALQEQLSALDWCDALTGQTDRHAFNYFVEVVGDKVTVTGIDNDMAFGQKQGNASVSLSEISSRRTPPGLPPLIDRKVYKEIDAKTFEGDVLPSLQGLLNKEELKATKARFEQTQSHARQLEKDGFVVDDWATWRHPADTALLPEDQRTAGQVLAGETDAVNKNKSLKQSGGLFGRDFAKFFSEEGVL